MSRGLGGKERKESENTNYCVPQTDLIFIQFSVVSVHCTWYICVQKIVEDKQCNIRFKKKVKKLLEENVLQFV